MPSNRHKLDVLREAYKEVREKGMAIRAAARKYALPEATLRRRVNKGMNAFRTAGFSTIFSRKQEEQLANHCVSMAHLGYGFTRWQVLEMADNMCDVLQINSKPTKHWFYGFLQRFPEIAMVKPKKREKARDQAVTKETLGRYFTELESVLKKYDLLNKPAHIWNVDETGISLDHNLPKVLEAKGYSTHMATSGKSPTATVIAAGSALGETIPPFVIYKGQRLSKQLITVVIRGTEYRVSSSGWSNSHLFLDFFKNHLLKHVSLRPLILLYDGHSTHVTCKVIEAAREEDVHLFVLPPHTSHCLQSLDVSVFSSFKKSLNAEMQEFLHHHPNQIITIEDLPAMIAVSYTSAMTVHNIMSGFWKSSIFPFNRAAVSIEPPTVNSCQPERSVQESRKQRIDTRAIKILFQEKTSQFNNLMSQQSPTVKKRRKSFVPPNSTPIAEDSYHEEKCSVKTDKGAPKKDSNRCSASRKRKNTFTPPFIAQIKPQEPKEREPQVEREDGTIAQSQRETWKGRGKGYKEFSARGKGPCKKKRQNVITSSEEQERCVVCKKWQPVGFNLDQGIKFLQWGQCDTCCKWVHLKYCTEIEHLGDDDAFLCPVCCHG